VTWLSLESAGGPVLFFGAENDDQPTTDSRIAGYAVWAASKGGMWRLRQSNALAVSPVIMAMADARCDFVAAAMENAGTARRQHRPSKLGHLWRSRMGCSCL
jgi:hypothetical protein